MSGRRLLLLALAGTATWLLVVVVSWLTSPELVAHAIIGTVIGYNLVELQDEVRRDRRRRR